MKFRYQARTKEGLVQIGVVEASSRKKAVSLLQDQNLYVTALDPETTKPFYHREIGVLSGINRKDVLSITRQLSLMIKSGVSLVEGLRAIALQTDKDKFREIILRVADDVEGGIYFSDALAKFPRAFSVFYVNMIKAGEASGKLAESLNYLADNLEREYTLLIKIKSGMTYPALVLLAFGVIGLLMLFFVLPSFSETIEDLNVKLPAITMAIISFGNFLKIYWWLVLSILIILAIALWRYLKTKEGREFWNEFSLKIPIIGGILRKIYIVRFTENLSTLIFAGLPITQALEVVSGLMTNKVYSDILNETKNGVRRGETISTVLERYPKSMPPTVVQMIKVGEKAGRLDESLLKISDFYRIELNTSVDRLISIIEPVLIVVLGGLIAGLMLSIFLPVYSNIGNFTL